MSLVAREAEAAQPQTNARLFGRFPSAYNRLPQDLVASLEQCAWQARLGNFGKCLEIWSMISSEDATQFVSVITLVDWQLRQTRYGDALETIEAALSNNGGYTSSEREMLHLLKAHCKIYTHGALRFAVAEASRLSSWLDNTDAELRDDFERVGTETWLHIMKYAKYNANFVSTGDDATQPQQRGLLASRGAWYDTDGYLQRLISQRHFWDALTLMKISARIQPQDLSRDQYKTLLMAVETDQSLSVDVAHCHLSTRISFARYQVLEGNGYEIEDAEFVKSLLADCQTYGPRQDLEIALLKAEISRSKEEPGTLYDVWEHAAEQAKLSAEYGIEEFCLVQYVQLAASLKDHTRLAKHQQRIEEIDGTLAKDIPALLANKCAQWRPVNRHDHGAIIQWLQAFDKKYPLSPYLQGDKDWPAGPEDWDLPVARYRAETIKRSFFDTAVVNQNYASESLDLARKLWVWIPLQAVYENGLADVRFLEWVDPASGEFLPVTQVLITSIKRRVGLSHSTKEIDTLLLSKVFELDLDQSADLTAVTKLLTLDSLRNNLFTSPFDEAKTLDKLDVIADWLQTDGGSKSESNIRIVASLWLDICAHAAGSGDPDIISRVNRLFFDYVDDLPASSMKDLFMRNALNSRQLASDVWLFWRVEISTDRLRLMRSEYESMLTQYETTWLCKELGKIAVLHARLAEVEIHLHDRGQYLTVFKTHSDQAVRSYDDLRAQVATLDPALTLQFRTSQKNAILGENQTIQRMISSLTVEHVRLGQDKTTQDRVGFLLWDLIQCQKSRALLTKLGASTVQPWMATEPPISSVRGSVPSAGSGGGRDSNSTGGDFEKHAKAVQDLASLDIGNDGDEEEEGPTSSKHESPAEPFIHGVDLPTEDRLDIGRLLLRKITSTVSSNDEERLLMRLVDRWRTCTNQLAQEIGAAVPDPTTIGNLRRAVQEAELEISGFSPAAAEIIRIIKGQAISHQDLQMVFQSTAEGVVFVDWFTADLPGVSMALHMAILRVSPSPLPPSIYRLRPGIGPLTKAWVEQHIHSSRIYQGRGQASFTELKALVPLVEPLLDHTEAGEILVFCPTSAWEVARVPLHAVDISGLYRSQELRHHESESGTIQNVMILRNPIVYTYSHSVLHANTTMRRSAASRFGPQNWHAAVFSPLSQLPEPQADVAYEGAFSESTRRKIRVVSTRLARFTGTEMVPPQQTTSRRFVSHSAHANMLFFLGHVHPPFRASPLSQHLMLYHPRVNPLCSPTVLPAHESDTWLSAEEMVMNCRLAPGSHATIMACASGVSGYLARDEPLGIVAGLFHSGVASTISSLWEIQADEACMWTTFFVDAWRECEGKMSKGGGGGGGRDQINLAMCYQRATRRLIELRGPEALELWGALVWHGDWMFPARRPS